MVGLRGRRHPVRGIPKVLAEGLSRSLVAANAKVGSARTVGQVQVHLLFGEFDLLAGSTDRVLNGPTSRQLLLPWIKQIENLGGTYLTERRVTAIHCSGQRITGVQVQDLASKQVTEVVADYYVCAMPVEVMGPLVNAALVAADPALATIPAIAPQVRWMNGIQFFLRTDVPVVHGHVLYVDSPWAITSISEAQFWSSLDLQQYGDGTVRGILSVDVSDWQAIGTFITEEAQNLDPDQIADEVWQELKRSLNRDGKVLLRDEDKVGYFMDTDIIDPHPAGRTPTSTSSPCSSTRRTAGPSGRRPAPRSRTCCWPPTTSRPMPTWRAWTPPTKPAVARSTPFSTGPVRARLAARCGTWTCPCCSRRSACTTSNSGIAGLPWNGGLVGGSPGPGQAGWAELSAAIGRHTQDVNAPIVPPAALSSPTAGAITLADDAYHLAQYLGASHLFWYTEWWYFNWVDPKTGKSGMVTFRGREPDRTSTWPASSA